MTKTDIGNTIARALLDAGAIHVNRAQPFILGAGWASPVYVDVRLLFGEPVLHRIVTDIAAHYVRDEFGEGAFDAIVGAETAGIPFSAWLADRLDLKLRCVRKRSLGFGHDAQVEGGPVDGLRVLLMDDLTTDGSSKLNFARGLRAAGARIEHILTIFYHNAFQDAAPRLQEAGLSLHALATWSDVVQADSSGALAREDRVEIERFLADPVAWSTRHGGRSQR